MTQGSFISHYRIDRQDAVKIVNEMSTKSVEECADLASTNHRMAYGPPVFTRLVTSEELEQIRADVLAIAETYGHPRREGEKSNHLSNFDVKVGDYLLSSLALAPADAGLEETWNFLSLVLLPDVAAWRFKNRSKNPEYDRWIGRPRNVFRKTWWRSYSLGPELNATLGEDEGVNIMERPTFGMNPVLARSIATVHRDLSTSFNDSYSKSELLRLFMVQLGKLSSIINLDAYSETEATKMFREIYLETANRF